MATPAKTKPTSQKETATPDGATATPDEHVDAPSATTTLDEHVDAPSVTAPGDGPADTTDPAETASTVIPDFATAAKAGHLTVNSAVPVAARKQAARNTPKDRIERYKRTKPDGTEVTVTHNVDTGETSVSD